MPVPPIRSLLVLVDGSDTAFKAVEYALRFASFTSAKLTDISVVDTDTLRKLTSARILVEEEVAEFEAELERSQASHLESVAHMARKAGVTVETVLRKGVIHSAVLHEQRAIDADLIVIGKRRRSTVEALLLGSTTRHVLADANCDVLVVPLERSAAQRR